MNHTRFLFLKTVAPVLLLAACVSVQPPADPLPSWTDGPSKQRIMEFVAEVTDPGAANFVPQAQRIATFDNDGTLWIEYPTYTQVLFAFDRVKVLAPQHPEWKTK